MRRLIDLPGVGDLELKALMKPRLADPDLRDEHPEVDAVARAAFGLSLDEADRVPLPADWPDHLRELHRQSPADLARAFEAEGWDVTDRRRKPLRLLPLFALPLALAARGVAGTLPFAAEPDHPATDWGANLKAEAGRFRKR
ncbi:hypothetical protein [Brevundimonas sp.]|uniref:hypothetical protein n=1 Tax=Brevundimonas sp. TaxID=1871086 RepID=UPI002D724056|nr:hypothetical protein [Brevundimonas sp.]HYC98773.1 hypothetical protein [Brevundimonas sp.]